MDLDYVLQIEYCDENRKFIIPWDIEEHRKSLVNENDLHLIIEEKEMKQRIGYVIVSGLNNIHNSIELVRIAVSNKGKGFGREALRLIKDYVFNYLNAHRLWLDVKVMNDRAKYLYDSEGFILEGTCRDCIKNGDIYESLNIMSIIKNEYDVK